MSEDVDTGRNPAPADPVRDHVDGVLRDLANRSVSTQDRGRLRKGLDQADAPQTGRPGADSALGRISRGL